jgi:gas vesicle protein
MKFTTEMIVALLSGAVVGSAVGLVLAPRKGEETRGLLREQTARIKDCVASRGILRK